jgi:outer membrane protein OmpA-like peptidoglycan-associated protein
MRRNVLAVAAGVCLWGQQGIQWQKPGPIEKPAGTWQTPGRIQKTGDIQKVKEQCRAKLIVSADALFDFDKSELTAGAEKVLSELGPMIRKEGVHPVSVEGHTDSVGTTKYNQTLSERRARTVESWLESRGYVIDKVTETRGFGETKPVATNETPVGRQKNRRVEIVINTCKS